MSMRSITVTISPMGNPVVEASGFNGVGCEAATKALEEALGGTATIPDRSFKPERYAEETQEVTQSW